MRLFSKTLPLLLVAMLFALPIYAQNGRLSGTARDKDGKPIANWTVSIERSDGSGRLQARTDNGGAYLAGVVPAGLYNVYLINPANNQPEGTNTCSSAKRRKASALASELWSSTDPPCAVG